MDLLSVLKFVHVASAIAWVGGGTAFAALAAILVAREGRRAALSVGKLLQPMGNVWFMPASLLTLVSGLSLFILGGWPIDGWSSLALALVGVVLAIGFGVMNPGGAKIGALMAAGEVAKAEHAAMTLLRFGRFEAICMAAIVALMVLKPSFDEPVALFAIATVVAVAAALIFVPDRRPAALT
ncbi:DUF2269 family protein [Rhodobacterales bacterium HKCCE2091]|nr:DUF2269 family protein [Rhodobacterales bacterium HKCCE2091]